ncbi:DUF1294 domain-containing protein [Alkaliphilus pronyensis]|nr:DUF1294 domain-containing protein [Alkaliphilus pronyensis]
MGIYHVLANSIGFFAVFYFIVVWLINIGAFILMVVDKKNAKKGEQRVPERVLLSLAFFSGAAGILLAMVMLHHKTSKKKFYIGIPLLFLLNNVINIFIIYFLNK